MPLVRKLCSLALAIGVGACVLGTSPSPARAADKAIRITIPKRSKPTPVQKLNRDGVKAIEKHDYKKAKTLFYRAYLIDPNDPFTLNNLGYVAELEGDVDRAQRFYDLAGEQSSDATVDRATVESLVGKPVGKVAGQAQDAAMEVNRLNVAAIGLLQKDRAPEADLMLQKALKLDSKNAYTLNNLGYANEKEGELETALNYYSAAANLNSREPIVVTAIADWRGKPISEIAARNADKVRSEMKKAKTVEQQVASLNLRGVSALNRNDRREARQYFEQANKLNPNDAFTLNNMGYLAELDGDRETAEFYYQKAQDAKRANATVGVATRRDAEGQKLAAVADANDQNVDQAFQKIIQEKRQQGGPVLLKRRDNTPVIEPDKPPPPLPEPQATSQPSEPPAGAPAGAAPAPAGPPGAQPAPAGNAPNGGVIEPLPDNAQPPGANTGATPPPANPGNSNPPQGGVIEPLPDTQQPPNADKGNVPPPANPPQQSAPQQQSNPPQGQVQSGVIEPLPDTQQPPNADKGNVPSPANPPQQSAPQQQSNPPQGQVQGGVIEPLPDTQQPPNADKGNVPPPANPPQTPH